MKWRLQRHMCFAYGGETGYNYRMSNVIADVVRGQLPHLQEHIAQKKAIYMRYKEGFKDLPVKVNPYDEANSEPNLWLSCFLIDKDAMCQWVLGETEALYRSAGGLEAQRLDFALGERYRQILQRGCFGAGGADAEIWH